MERMTLLERKVDELLQPYQDYFFESPIFDDTNAGKLLEGCIEPCSATALRLLACAASHYW